MVPMFIKVQRYNRKKLNGLGFWEIFCFTFACQPENPFLPSLIICTEYLTFWPNMWFWSLLLIDGFIHTLDHLPTKKYKTEAQNM